MEEMLGKQITQEIIKVQQLILKATQDLSPQMLGHRVAGAGPPIGWHLWHVARWADRLQASIQPRPGDSEQVWKSGGLAASWELPPGTSGLLETGTSMTSDTTDALAKVGPGELLGYARVVFEKVDSCLEKIHPEDLQSRRESIKAFRVIDGRVTPARGEQTTMLADLVFHLVHASRHLGMIEALRGLLLDGPGSATV